MWIFMFGYFPNPSNQTTLYCIHQLVVNNFPLRDKSYFLNIFKLSKETLLKVPLLESKAPCTGKYPDPVLILPVETASNCIWKGEGRRWSVWTPLILEWDKGMHPLNSMRPYSESWRWNKISYQMPIVNDVDPMLDMIAALHTS